jgi:probable phosphoglycerate mutase
MILYYIRHGDPIYDPDSLTELGHKQAKALVARTTLYGLDEIYCSTSNRAKLTAQPTCEALGKEMILLDWANEGYAFAEMSIPKPDGSKMWMFQSEECRKKMNAPEVKARGAKWYEDPYFPQTCGAGVQRVDKEVDNFLLSLGYKHNRETGEYELLGKKNEKRVALFAHQGFGMLFLSSLLDIPYNIFSTHFDMSTSAVTAILFGEDGETTFPTVLQLSNDSHLFKADLMTGYHNCIKV